MDILQWNLFLLIIGLVIYAILNAVCVVNNYQAHGKQKKGNITFGLRSHNHLWFLRTKRLSKSFKRKYDEEVVHVWASSNPVTGEEYGGPRALGNRSITVSPLKAEMKDT